MLRTDAGRLLCGQCVIMVPGAGTSGHNAWDGTDRDVVRAAMHPSGTFHPITHSTQGRPFSDGRIGFCFPAPLPDETVYSLVARYHLTSPFAGSKQTLSQLCGTWTFVPSSGLPSHLDALFSSLAPGAVPSVRELIEGHTLLPYYRPVLPGARLAALEAAMRSSDGRGIKTLAGLVAGRVGADDPLRFCTHCVREDLVRHPHTYWRRSHQLPGVIVCHRHETPLHVRQFAPNRPSRHALTLPVPAPPSSQCVDLTPSELTPERMRRAVHVASLSHQWLSTAPDYVAPQNLEDAYKAALDGAGLLTSGNSVRQDQLQARFADHYRPLGGFPQYAALVTPIAGELPWLASLVRKARRVTQPLKHILLIGLLFPTFDDFLAAVGGAVRGELRGEPRASVSTRHPPLAERLAAVLADGRVSLRQASTSLGVSVTTLSVLAERYGIPVGRKRPKRVARAVERRALASLRRGRSIADAAKDFALSEVHLRRLLLRNPKSRYRRDQCLWRRRRRAHRGALSAALATLGPESSRKTIRALATAAYAWLYRNDREWLWNALPACRDSVPLPKDRLDWRRRDQSWAEAVRNQAEILMTKDGVPVRVTLTTLARAAAILPVVEKHPEKVPQTMTALDVCVEPVEHFQVRRIRWAAQRLAEQGLPAAAWRIRRAAGLPSHLPPVVHTALREACGQMLLLPLLN